MDVWCLIASLFSILHTVHTEGTTHTSKACFGTPGLNCTQHNIRCSGTQKIDIYDAYYTDNNVCGATGSISNCLQWNLDNMTESGQHRFINTHLALLCKHCFKETKCVFPSPRRNAKQAFSVIKYECFESHLFNKSEMCQGLDEADGITGAAVGATVGGVVASVLAVFFIVVATVWYVRKRRDNTDERQKISTHHQDETAHKIPCNISDSHYQEIEDLTTRGNSSDYDYATADGMSASPNMNTFFTIEPVTKPNTKQNPATSTIEDDYDHIGDKPSALTSNYDTTASVAQSAGTGAHPREDDYGYNLLQKETNAKTVQNDYDTTASANKAVAQFERNDEKTQFT